MIPDIETQSVEAIKIFQEQKLAEALQYLDAKSKFYKTLFKSNNISISEIKTIEDLQQIPVTTKTDLQRHNTDFICVDKTEIVDYNTTSGTLGEPVFFPLTENDLERLAYNEAISFATAQVTKTDVLQLMTTIDKCFMAGLAYFLGAKKIGAGIIRLGIASPAQHWDSILKFEPNYLIAVPSFLIKLKAFALQNNFNLNATSIKRIICIGEPIRQDDFSLNALGKKITENWNVELFSTYASTEMATAFTECEVQQGGHHHPELVIVEILDEKNETVKPGEVGELTITTLGLEAMPLLRYKTGDMVKAHTKFCSCGRQTLRLSPVFGRKQQMIKLKGTTLYPPAIQNVLNDVEFVIDYVIEIHHSRLDLDEVIIKTLLQNPSEDQKEKLINVLKSKLRVTPKIELASAEDLFKLKQSKGGRKPVTILDYRKQF
ncbi:phenylacetate--CoA ligase family protein [Aurantibacter aestuarii]|uniref:Phenylacetate--CoA ligase n=1 Tax=Aurantibacter aestuarii TaxID=1266046 RepID=A0A2T1NDF4_9FLAO|nr:AMP-binding protein [Aurantibacter aestuarii]PSG90475.1 phenylacetate--CoA ligase [Aurantibacter aestuarii]